MRVISARNWTGSLVCLLLVLSFAGCTCGPEADVSPPTDIPSAVPSPTSTLPPPELDTSLLTDDPCRAPCWHNIIPGVSGEDDVRAQLQSSPFIREGTLNYELTEEAGVPIGLFYWQARSEHYNRIILQDEVVLRMEVWIDHDWTLGEVVDKFGSPEYVLTYVDCLEGCLHVVEFYYPVQGLEFESVTFDREDIISRDLEVTSAIYFASTSLEGMISKVHLYPPEMMENWLADIREWEGFEDW